MPLTDLIRYFNAADSAEDSMLYLDGERAAAWHKGLRLGSLFQPIVDLQQQRVIGHQAILSARREDGSPVSSEEAYDLCDTAESLVHFDRLNRTLHALNFLAQQRSTGGYLQLAVHPRHLRAVQNQHGLVYEAILKRCGLAPADIVLDINTEQIGDHASLRQALSNYQQRGYRLALGALGVFSSLPELAGLLSLQPSVLKLRPEESREALELARKAGIAAEWSGIETAQDFALARAAGVSLGQGSFFGRPQADCQPTHSDRRVAYNSASSFGAKL